MLFQDRLFDFFAQGFNRFGASDFARRVEHAFNSVAGHLISNFEQLRFGAKQRHFAFWLGDPRRELFLNANYFPRLLMRELERFQKIGFWQFVSRAFDHDHVVFQAHVNQIESALLTLGVSRVRHELAVNAADTHRTDRSSKWNV